MNNVIKFKKFRSDFLLEIWQQDLFGNGISAEFNGEWKLSEMLGINFNLGYKTEGYLLGKQLESGLNVGAGICIYKKQ